jgi:hypothetical protein
MHWRPISCCTSVFQVGLWTPSAIADHAVSIEMGPVLKGCSLGYHLAGIWLWVWDMHGHVSGFRWVVRCKPLST